MKKTLKRPVTVFFVLALICTVAWLAAFALFGLLAKEVNFDFQIFYEKWLNPRIEAFPKLFTGDLYGFVPDGHEQFYLTYVAFGLIGIMVIMMIVGLILVIKRKRARYIPFGLVMLVACVAASEIVVMLNVYYIDYFTFKLDGKEVANIAFSYGVIVTAILAYIFSFIEAILGCKYAKQLREAPKAQEEAAPVVEEQPVVEEAPVVEEQPQDVNELFATAPAESEEFVATQPVEERSEDYDTMADFATEPEEQVAQPEEIVVEEVPQQKDAVTKDDLAAILKDVVRDIVRDEIARANAAKAEQEHEHTHRDGDHSITGATFGGPLVVQYFNGGINGQTSPFPPQPPVTQPAPVVVNNAAPAPAPAPVEEPKKEEPAPAPIVVEPAPVVVVPVEEPKEEEPNKNPIIRIPFTERMLDAEKDMKDNYNELKNEIMSYGVNSRVSNSGDTFRLHRKTYVKITIAGKSLKLYFALDPRDYADSKMPIGDASHHAVYAEIPLIFKVKSGLSLRRAKELIRDVMSKDGLEQGEVESVNWVKELKAAQK